VKQAGYLAVSLIFNERSEILRLIIGMLKNDLQSNNDQIVSLALHCIANIGGKEFAESLATDVQQVLFSARSRSIVRKKAALALLRLYRKNPDVIPDEDTFPPKMLSLLDDNNIGVLTSITSLLIGVCSHTTRGFEVEAPIKLSAILYRLVFFDAQSPQIRSVYKYYNTLCPWLQVKVLKLLQYFPPSNDTASNTRLAQSLNKIITGTQMTRNANKNNADHAILFEAVKLVIHLARFGNTQLADITVKTLWNFIRSTDLNMRYLGLETMAKMTLFTDALPAIRAHQSLVINLLKDPDVSLRKRAIDLLFAVCDRSSVEEVVNNLLDLLRIEQVEYREELVLKIAILAESFAPSLTWYVDVVIQLLSAGGAFISDDIWYRVVQLVANNESLQDYASTKCFEVLRDQAGLHENGIKLTSYILGEFGHTIRDPTITGEAIFNVMMNKFRTASSSTRGLMLTSFAKMFNSYPELVGPIVSVFESCKTSMDPELQQRAVEYLMLSRKPDHIAKEVLNLMPPYPEKENTLLRTLQKKTKSSADRDVWSQTSPVAASASTLSGGATPEASAEPEAEPEAVPEAAQAPQQNTSLDILGSLLGTSTPAATPAAQPAAPAASIGGLASLLDVASAAPASSAAPAASAGGSGLFDIFGAAATPAPAAADPVVPADAYPKQRPTQIIDVLRGESEIIYQSPVLSIACRTQTDPTAAHTVRMALVVANDASYPLQNVVLEPPGQQEILATEIKQDRFDTIAPQSQERFLIKWTALRPFESPPFIVLHFSHPAGRESLTLRVPVLIANFFAKRMLRAEEFNAGFSKLASQTVKRFELGTTITPESVKTLLENCFRMHIVDGCDSFPGNVYAVGQFTALKPSDGSSVTIVTCLKIETRPNVTQIRVTCHSAYAQVGSAILKCIQHVFKGTPIEQ